MKTNFVNFKNVYPRQTWEEKEIKYLTSNRDSDYSNNLSSMSSAYTVPGMLPV